MNLREFQEAGSLAQEIPFWGWVDNRTCLTRGGELFTLARLTPATATGLQPDQVTRIIERWQRALSNLPPETRFYWIFLRRPVAFDPPARRYHRRARETPTPSLARPSRQHRRGIRLLVHQSFSQTGRPSPTKNKTETGRTTSRALSPVARRPKKPFISEPRSLKRPTASARSSTLRPLCSTTLPQSPFSPTKQPPGS